jgi:hypothetical protein
VGRDPEVQATIAGVLLAFTIPASGVGGRRTEPLLPRLEHALQPWVAFGIMPAFALANAGVRLTGDISASLLDPISLGPTFRRADSVHEHDGRDGRIAKRASARDQRGLERDLLLTAL